MIGFLRLAGLLNAAIWLGAAVSFTFAIGPAFFSDEMKALLHPAYYSGAAAQIVMKRYFILSYCCGAIALIHLILERLYLGKAIERLKIGSFAVAISLGLLGGIVMQPVLRDLHIKKYSRGSSVQLRAQADRSFKVWHGVSQTLNLFVIGGLLVYFWQVSQPANGSRFVSSHKFRG